MLDEAVAREARELVNRLDRLIPRDGALLMVPANYDGNTMVGNQAGYLRFGLEFIAAALEPQPKTARLPMHVLPDLDYLLREGAQTPFNLCEIDEAVVDRPPVKASLGPPTVAIVAGIVIVFFLIGVTVAWRWIFS